MATVEGGGVKGCSFRMKEHFLKISSFVALVQDAIKLEVFEAMKSDHSSFKKIHKISYASYKRRIIGQHTHKSVKFASI